MRQFTLEDLWAFFRCRINQAGAMLKYMCLLLTVFMAAVGCSEENAAKPVVPEELTITIQNPRGETTTFRVLESYLTPGLNVLDGTGTTIVIEAMWPDMAPAIPLVTTHNKTSSPDLAKKLNDNILFITIHRGWDFSSKRMRNVNIYPPEAPQNLQVINGLYSLGRVQSQNPRSDTGWSGQTFSSVDGKLSIISIPNRDYYVPVSNKFESSYYYCIFPEVSVKAKCVLTKDVNRDVRIVATFPRRLMDDWQEVDARVTEFISSLIVE